MSSYDMRQDVRQSTLLPELCGPPALCPELGDPALMGNAAAAEQLGTGGESSDTPLLDSIQDPEKASLASQLTQLAGGLETLPARSTELYGELDRVTNRLSITARDVRAYTNTVSSWAAAERAETIDRFAEEFQSSYGADDAVFDSTMSLMGLLPGPAGVVMSGYGVLYAPISTYMAAQAQNAALADRVQAARLQGLKLDELSTRTPDAFMAEFLSDAMTSSIFVGDYAGRFGIMGGSWATEQAKQVEVNLAALADPEPLTESTRAIFEQTVAETNALVELFGEHEAAFRRTAADATQALSQTSQQAYALVGTTLDAYLQCLVSSASMWDRELEYDGRAYEMRTPEEKTQPPSAFFFNFHLMEIGGVEAGPYESEVSPMTKDRATDKSWRGLQALGVPAVLQARVEVPREVNGGLLIERGEATFRQTADGGRSASGTELLGDLMRWSGSPWIGEETQRQTSAEQVIWRVLDR